ncbi:anti-virulence regulator CigR family protein [Pseudomonas chlororaphis]|uniref:anti-virulence regulator CigR family protein n=1 Tax=Pseudomonas chlororaphis TaxID=587753 RepID=UPI00406D4463
MFRAGSLISIVSILLSIPLDADAAPGAQANARYSNDHANWERLPVVNYYQVKTLLQASKRDWSPTAALPADVRQNLRRGRTLPAQQSRRLNPRLLRQLPRYDGYQWWRAGSDLLLVRTSNQMIFDVLADAFQ